MLFSKHLRTKIIANFFSYILFTSMGLIPHSLFGCHFTSADHASYGKKELFTFQIKVADACKQPTYSGTLPDYVDFSSGVYGSSNATLSSTAYPEITAGIPTVNNKVGIYPLTFQAIDRDYRYPEVPRCREGPNVVCSQNFELTITEPVKTPNNLTINQKPVTQNGDIVEARAKCQRSRLRKCVRYRNILKFESAIDESDIVAYQIFLIKGNKHDPVFMAEIPKNRTGHYTFKQCVRNRHLTYNYIVYSINDMGENLGVSSKKINGYRHHSKL